MAEHATDQARVVLPPPPQLSTAAEPADLAHALLPKLEAPRVLIVGAGLGGLAAAYDLQKLGITAELFEANPDRLGGRIWTDTNQHGDLIERGASLINERHTDLIALVKELGLTLKHLYLAGQEGAELEFFIKGPGDSAGRTYTQDEFTRAVQPLSAHIKQDLRIFDDPSINPERANALQRMSIEQYLKGVEGLEPWVTHGIDLFMSSELGRKLSELPATLVMHYGFDAIKPGDTVVLDPGYGKYTVEGGNSQIIDRLGERLGSQVHQGYKLLSAKNSENGCELRFEVDGRQIVETADIVIFALPFTALRRVDLSELNLTDQRREAIQRMPYADHTKIHVHGKSGNPTHTGAVVMSDAVGGFGWTDDRQESIPSNRTLDLPGTAGRAMAARLQTESGRKEVAAELDQAFGGTHSTDFVVSPWDRKVGGDGSYSTFDKSFDFDGLAEGYSTHIPAEGLTYFAGEHIVGEDPNVRGFMAGARHSALVAARKVADAYYRIVDRLRRDS